MHSRSLPSRLPLLSKVKRPSASLHHGAGAERDEVSEARRLDALTCEETVDRRLVDAKNTTNADGIHSPLMDQAPDRLGVDAELSRHVPHGVETF